MSLTPNKAATFSMTLRVGGVPLIIAAASTVTAALYTADGVTMLSPVIPCLSTAIGANWPAGLVVVDFTAANTAGITAPACSVLISLTSGGSTRTWTAVVPVSSSSNDKTALFNRATALPDLRTDRLLLLAGSLQAGGDLSDDYLWGKLQAAEADARRQLKVFFEPTKILPEDEPQAVIDALDAAGTPYFQEANYDYDADFFAGDRWGDVYLHQKPVISIETIEIAYPFAGMAPFVIPADWIRIDRKYGLLRLIPMSSLIAGQMAALRMQIMSAGRMMPFTIRLHYTAGLKNAARDYPDLLDCVKKMAVLRIVEDMFLPQSGSISADGLSQSLSTDVSKYQDVVDRMLFGTKGANGGLFAAIHGIQLGVL